MVIDRDCQPHFTCGFFISKDFKELKKGVIFAPASGGMAEWSNAAVLKTVEGHTSGGSNPSSSAKETRNESCGFCVFGSK